MCAGVVSELMALVNHALNHFGHFVRKILCEEEGCFNALLLEDIQDSCGRIIFKAFVHRQVYDLFARILDPVDIELAPFGFIPFPVRGNVVFIPVGLGITKVYRLVIEIIQVPGRVIAFSFGQILGLDISFLAFVFDYAPVFLVARLFNGCSGQQFPDNFRIRARAGTHVDRIRRKHGDLLRLLFFRLFFSSFFCFLLFLIFLFLLCRLCGRLRFAGSFCLAGDYRLTDCSSVFRFVLDGSI